MEIVELNVGGRHFTTTRSTLCKYSGSMLAAMFSGEMQPAQQDSQGRFFIDRSGDWFAIILSHLREEPIQVPQCGVQRLALIGEARYYQLQELERQLAPQEPRAAYQIGHSGLQKVLSKLTYWEGCAVLYESAKEHIGANKVHAICEAMVQAYFLRGRQFENGKDWLDNIGSDKLADMFVLDPQQIGPTGRFCRPDPTARLDLTRHISNFARVTPSDFCDLMKEYQDLFVREMKQLGFLLKACAIHDEWNRSLGGWLIQAVHDKPA